MEFKDARAFAENIKTEQHEYAAEPEDLEIRTEAIKAKYGKEIEEMGLSLPRNFTPVNTAYQEVVQGIAAEFYATLSPTVRRQFEEHFYFTTIDNRSLNARIMRSSDNRFYGVFIYSSLITALHRLGKLELSMHFPESVEFCSRFPGESVTRRQMVEIYAEAFVYFSTYKLPLGPQVLLKEPLNSYHHQKLDIQEKLIVFHEIAHFLNGDFEVGSTERIVFELFPNENYQKEHTADIVGFGLVLRQFKHFGELTRELRYLILICLIDLHRIQHVIQGIETHTYPHPLNRMSLVIGKFYGNAVEEWVAEAILNKQTAKLNLSDFPEFESDEAMIFEYIEQRLVKAFDF